MSKEEKLKNIISNIENLRDVNFEILYSKNKNTQPFPNHSIKDIESLVVDTLRILFSLSENQNLLEDLSFEYLSKIDTYLNNFIAQFKTLKTLKKEQLRNQHHNPLNQLKALNNLFRQYGIYSILTPSVDIPDLEEQLKKLSGEASKIVKEAEDNAKIIRDLIPEATATSLSTTLRDRARQLSSRVNLWLSIVIIVLVSSAILSWVFLTSNAEKPVLEKSLISTVVADSLKTNNNLEKNSNYGNNMNSYHMGNNNINDNSWEYWLKRIIIFLPLFYLIVFSIRQYNKERKLLEIYTHKRAIAQSLPAYMEQAGNNEEIKSELLIRGASMIFTLPENPDTPIQGSDGIAVNELRSFLQMKKDINQ